MATITPAQQNAVSALYIALFNRAPDADGFNFWTNGLANGASLTSVINAFLGSPEARSIYTSTQTQEQFVAAFYQTVFGRSADTGGLQFWTGVLNTAAQNDQETAKAVLVSKIIEVVATPLPIKPADLSDAQYSQTVADRDLFGKKLVAGLNYAVTQQGNDLSIAKQLIANLTTPPSAPSTPAGLTLRLTTGPSDTLTGGAGDDTFDASLDGGLQTLQLGETLDGGAGRDTLLATLNFAYNGTGVFTAKLSNIEVIRVTAHGAADTKFNLAASSGFTDVGFDGSTIAHAITSVGNAALSVSNQTQNATFGGSTATTLSLTLSKVGAPGSEITVDLAGTGLGSGAKATTHNIVANDAHVFLTYGVASEAVTSATVAATGTNRLTLATNDANTLTSLTVTGSGSVDLSSQGLSALKTFTAGDGGVKLRSLYATASDVVINTGGGADTIIAAGAGIKTLNTRAGNDIVTIASTSLAVGASVNLGDGDDWLELEATPNPGSSINGGLGRDTLAVTTASFDPTVINGVVTGFEVLALKDGLTVNVGNVTAMTEFLVANTGTTTFTNATNTSKFEIANTGSTVAAVNIANASGNATTIALSNQSTTTDDLSVTALSLSGGITTVALSSTSTGGGTGKNVITTLNHSDGATINITGSTDLTITNALAGTAAGSTVNASAFAGKLTVTGSGFNDTLTGGAANDTIAGGGGIDTLTGGSGNDIFKFASRAETRDASFALSDTSSVNLDKITDFNGNGAAAGDSITLGIGANQFGASLQFTASTVVTRWGMTYASATNFGDLFTQIGNLHPNDFSSATTAVIYDVIVNTGPLAGRYLVVNDEVAGLTLHDTVIALGSSTPALDAQDFTFA